MCVILCISYLTAQVQCVLPILCDVMSHVNAVTPSTVLLCSSLHLTTLYSCGSELPQQHDADPCDDGTMAGATSTSRWVGGWGSSLYTPFQGEPPLIVQTGVRPARQSTSNTLFYVSSLKSHINSTAYQQVTLQLAS